MNSINEVLSPKLKVAPLSEGQTVTYKLMNAGVVDPTTEDQDGNKKVSSPVMYSFAAHAQIRDPEQKRNIVIGNIVGHQPIMKEGKKTNDVEPSYGPVQFSSGFITVNEKTEGTYFFLERHPRNADNPFRDRTRPPLFYKVDYTRNVKHELDTDFLKAEMILYVKDIDKSSELYALAASVKESDVFDINLNNKTDFLKKDLINAINTNVLEFVRQSDNEEAIWKLRLQELQTVEAVEFVEDQSSKDHRTWKIKRTVGESGIKKICIVEPGMDPYDGIVTYLLTPEADDARQALMEKYDEFYGEIA